jgi:hypothetical protein
MPAPAMGSCAIAEPASTTLVATIAFTILFRAMELPLWLSLYFYPSKRLLRIWKSWIS